MLSLTSVSASEVVIRDVADKFRATLPKGARSDCHGLPSAGFEPTLANAGFERNRLRPLDQHATICLFIVLKHLFSLLYHWPLC